MSSFQQDSRFLRKSSFLLRNMLFNKTSIRSITKCRKTLTLVLKVSDKIYKTYQVVT